MSEAATTADVLAGRATHAVAEGDAVAFLRGLPDDSLDLLFTSPPYELARTYGMKGRMVGGQAWVDWMVEVVRVAAPKVRGLIAVNCEGQTRGYRYSCTPFLLVADLHRAGFNLRKPAVFHRVGIPGGGGPDWLRNDWEPVICVTRPDRLPWSDNVACGLPPKYESGGDMSYRKPNGDRVGMRITVCNPDKKRLEQSYIPPEKANPGNVIHCNTGFGHMGHALAHENEAPFPLELPAFFVRTFCPPGGVVCDPFTGSGTTGHAAIEHGRRFVGCDLRASQVSLALRRLSTVTPPLFTDAA